MKRTLSLLLTAFTFSIIAAPRIAVFDEPGFPNASERTPEFYIEATGGTKVKLNDLKKLKDFDVVIFPHGGYVPGAAETAVGELLSRGRTVIVTGDIQTPPPPGGLTTSGPLEYDRISGRWTVPAKGAVYDIYTAPAWFPEFDLQGWPNYAQRYGKS